MRLDAQVMEKAPAGFPMTANAKQRVRKAFSVVKSQVDIDLQHFRRDVAALLHRDGTLPDDEELLHRWVPAQLTFWCRSKTLSREGRCMQ
jgi:hypothetical protein